jgi:hypothetical protein
MISWRGSQLKKRRDNFTFLPLHIDLNDDGSVCNVTGYRLDACGFFPGRGRNVSLGRHSDR